MDRRIQRGINELRSSHTEVASAFEKAEQEPGFSEDLERDPEGAITRKWGIELWRWVLYFADHGDPLAGQVHTMIRQALEELSAVKTN